jgi:S1-C subfamily serine protease
VTQKKTLPAAARLVTHTRDDPRWQAGRTDHGTPRPPLQPRAVGPAGRRVRALVAVSVVALGFALPACGGDNSDAESERKSQLTRAGRATVTVVNHAPDKTYRGSGVVYDAGEGLVLTAASVIWNRDSLEAITHDGQEYHARLVARSPCADIAVLLLHPRPHGLTQVPIGDSGALRSGESVTAMGYRAGSKQGQRTLTETHGNVAATNLRAELDHSLPVFRSVVEHQAPVTESTAGGPLIDAHGRIVAINTLLNTYGEGGASSGLYYGSSGDYIETRLDELTPTRHSFYKGWEAEHKCHHEFDMLVRSYRKRNMKDGEKQDKGHHDAAMDE